jgi:hypothetical protein
MNPILREAVAKAKKTDKGSDYVPGSIFNDPKAWDAARRRNAARKAEAEMMTERNRPKTVMDGQRAWQTLLASDVRRRRVKKAISPILSEAVAKAARSLNAPKNKRQAARRAALYDRVAQNSPNGPAARIAGMEAARNRDVAAGGKYGRGMTEGRAFEEKARASRAYRDDVRSQGRGETTAEGLARHGLTYRKPTNRSTEGLLELVRPDGRPSGI